MCLGIITALVREVVSEVFASMYKRGGKFAKTTSVDGYSWLALGEPLVIGHGNDRVYAGKRIYVKAGDRIIGIGEIRRAGAVLYRPAMFGGFHWISNFKGNENQAAIAVWNKLEKKQGTFNNQEMLAVRSSPEKTGGAIWLVFNKGGIAGEILSNGSLRIPQFSGASRFKYIQGEHDANSAMERLSELPLSHQT